MPGPPLTGGAAILARLRSQKAQAAKAPSNEPKAITILYASQTGTAEDIAMSIHADCDEKGIKAKVSSCNDFGFGTVSIEKTPIIVFVVSSTGDGDPPDNSSTFFRDMKKAPSDRLKGIQYTVLGLGDSNYTSFMHVPREFHRKCREMGATMFYEYKEADEVDGLDDITEAWVDGIWDVLKKATKGAPSNEPASTKQSEVPAVQKLPSTASTAANGNVEIPRSLDDLHLKSENFEGVPALPVCKLILSWEENPDLVSKVLMKESNRPTDDDLHFRSTDGAYTQQTPLWAEVSDARLMTASWSDRRVIHVEVDLKDSGMEYIPGDSIGVLPENSAVMVDNLIERVGVSSTQVFRLTAAENSNQQEPLPHLNCPCSVQHALTFGCDLASPPRKLLLRYLAESCSEASDKAKLLFLCSRSGKDIYKACVLEAQLSLIDILDCFPSCRPSLEFLLDLLPPLAPRMYSAASCISAHSQKVQFAFTLAKITTPKTHREGVATGWMNKILHPMLSSSGPSPKLPIFVKSGGAFRAPDDLSRPWVLIGPGTGVAPFKGFLEERKAKLMDYTGTAGECWLFFGCRKRDEDFLYKDDLQKFLADGTLTSLELAFSREQDEKVYVQHRMKATGDSLYKLLFQQNGYVFLCGDGANMARDVHQCLIKIQVEYGGASEVAAKDKLTEMTQAKTYVRDVWS